MSVWKTAHHCHRNIIYHCSFTLEVMHSSINTITRALDSGAMLTIDVHDYMHFIYSSDAGNIQLTVNFNHLASVTYSYMNIHFTFYSLCIVIFQGQ